MINLMSFIFPLLLSTADSTSEPVASADFSSFERISVVAADYYCNHQIELDSCNYLPLYQEAYEWMGVPYRWAGTTKKGVDCAALTRNLYEAVYKIKLAGNAVVMHQIASPIAKEELQEGDLLFWAINSKSITHVGVYLKDGYFVHATTARGVMINHISDAYYTRWYHSAGRIK